MFWRRNKKKDFSILKVDMHSHLVENIDDGAKDEETSFTLLQSLYKLGYTKLIVTPHTMSSHYPNTPDIIKKGIENLRYLAKETDIPIEIEGASEYFFDEKFEQMVDDKTLLTFGEKKYVLFELSHFNCPFNLFDINFRMQTSGYTPVLAHPERYPYWYNKLEVFKELKEKGILLQLDLLSLIGEYSTGAKKTAKMLIKNGMYDFAGTDCHNKRHITLYPKVLRTKLYQQLIANNNLLNTTL